MILFAKVGLFHEKNARFTVFLTISWSEATIKSPMLRLYMVRAYVMRMANRMLFNVYTKKHYDRIH